MSEEQRKQVLSQVDELLKSWLDNAEEWWPQGFRVREVGIVYDVEFTDEKGLNELVSYSCSEERDWASAGLFRAAMRVADDEDADVAWVTPENDEAATSA